MDNRTWVDRAASELSQGIQVWHTWSKNVGMKESPSKIQMVARTPKKKRELLQDASKHFTEDEIRRCVKEAAELLGATTVGGRGRKVEGKKGKRLLAAKDMLSQLRSVPLKRQTKLAMARAFGVFKTTYGWFGRPPTNGEARKVTSQV